MTTELSLRENHPEGNIRLVSGCYITDIETDPEFVVGTSITAALNGIKMECFDP